MHGGLRARVEHATMGTLRHFCLPAPGPGSNPSRSVLRSDPRSGRPNVPPRRAPKRPASRPYGSHPSRCRIHTRLASRAEPAPTRRPMSSTRLLRAAYPRRVGGKAEVQMGSGYDWQRGCYDIPAAGACLTRSLATSSCVAVNSANSTHRMSSFQAVECERSERSVTERNRASRL